MLKDCRLPSLMLHYRTRFILVTIKMFGSMFDSYVRRLDRFHLLSDGSLVMGSHGIMRRIYTRIFHFGDPVGG